MTHFFGSIRWFAWGPFSLQAYRILQYALYFLVGVWVGMKGSRVGLFERMGPQAQRWWLLGIAALVAFAMESASAIIYEGDRE
jgi:hypothetical protein